MKGKLLLLFLFSSIVVFGQQKQFKITWEDAKTISGETFSVKIPAFNKENFTYSFDDGLLL